MYDVDELPDTVLAESKEGTQRARLMDRLKARHERSEAVLAAHEKTTNGHAQPSEAVEPVIVHPPPAEAATAAVEPEPREPSTEWGQWVTDAVEAANLELRKYPVDAKVVRIHARQLTNHLVKIGVNQGRIVEDFIAPNGKRDVKRCAAALGEMWIDDVSWFMAQAGIYLNDYIQAAAAKTTAVVSE